MGKRCYIEEMTAESDEHKRANLFNEGINFYMRAVFASLNPIPKQDIPIIIATLGTIKNYFEKKDPIDAMMARPIEKDMIDNAIVLSVPTSKPKK